MKIERVCLALGLLGVLGAATALAATPEGGSSHAKKPAPGTHRGWDAFASRFDANKDGKVSKEELLGRQPGFDRVDTNKDGVVTADEVKALKQSAGKGGGQKKGKQGFIERFDADKDGKVTLAEFNEKRGKGFEGMDKNKDGVVDRGEFEAKVQAAVAARDLVEAEE